jgi:hypothetical protein
LKKTLKQIFAEQLLKIVTMGGVCLHPNFSKGALKKDVTTIHATPGFLTAAATHFVVVCSEIPNTTL